MCHIYSFFNIEIEFKFTLKNVLKRTLFCNILKLVILISFFCTCTKDFEYKAGLNCYNKGKYIEALEHFKSISNESRFHPKKDSLISSCINRGNIKFSKKIMESIDNYEMINAISIFNTFTNAGFVLNDSINSLFYSNYYSFKENEIKYHISSYNLDSALQIANHLYKITGKKIYKEEKIKSDYLNFLDEEIKDRIASYDLDGALRIAHISNEISANKLYKDDKIKSHFLFFLQNNSIEAPYRDLIRNEDKFYGECIYIKGEVVQTYENNDIIRVATKMHGVFGIEFGYSGDDYWVHYHPDAYKFIEEDVLKIWGIYKGNSKAISQLTDEFAGYVPKLELIYAEIINK